MAKRRDRGGGTTPAIALLMREGVKHALHEYVHDARAESYGLKRPKPLGLRPSGYSKRCL